MNVDVGRKHFYHCRVPNFAVVESVDAIGYQNQMSIFERRFLEKFDRRRERLVKKGTLAETEIFLVEDFS